MKRIPRLVFVLILSCFIALSGCGAEKETKAELVFRFYRSAAGDAKLMSKKILMTCINRKLISLNFETGEVINTDIESDWLSVLPEENLVIYTNHHYELGVVHLNDDGSVRNQEVILTNDSADFMIDPAIIKIDGMYYITLTFLNGTMNASEFDDENGQYTINCYCSKDLKRLEYLGRVTSEYRNLEDVKLAYNDGKLYIVYEKETKDKSNSSIMMSVSKDLGRTWAVPKTILDCVADQEPAGLVKTEKGWNLYYSSDVENPGQSYDGASAYIAKLSEDLTVEKKDIFVSLATPVTSDTETNQKGGILLYSVESFDGRTYYAYSEDHASADNLCVSASAADKKK
ncbi:MAG: hypothetical protein Q4A32_09420 [Lachnospiraceae bacterium]|nr:hypothetical protein [Lachnospiraceae bacterium]